MKPVLKLRESSISDSASPAPGVAVDVAGVSCSFGRVKALDGVSLRVPEGTVAGIVGPNGAGKTTLIDVICGLIRPDEGTARVLG